MLADVSLLTQLFENLFRNAVVHADETPTVTVGVTSDGFFVVDDGPGIPVENHDSVFEVGVSMAEPRGGTGMGLAIGH